MLDIDDDGDLDIVTNEFNTRPQVLRNNLSDTGRIHYVKIKLTGSESNRDALGAIVVVKTMYGAQRQLNNGASGYLSQSIMPLYFGLGTAEEIQEISVIWPSGKTQILPGPLKANRVVEITEQ